MPRITGKKQAADRLNQGIGPRQIEQVSQALKVGGDMIRSEASRLITENAVSGKFHVRSLPGQPPNEEFGDLRRGIEVEQPAPLRVLVTSNAGHAVPLEFGTSKMAARPYMGPASRNKRADVVKVVRQAVKITLRAGRGR